MRRLLLGLSIPLAMIVVITGSAFAQERPSFKLGFKALADQVPDVVGQPLENERWGANGDSLQRTSTGLMAWRKGDNWTAFTNGSRSWINGPNGVQERSNEERFEWEAADAPAEAAPAATKEPAAATTPTPQQAAPVVSGGPFVPDVKAMDAENAGPGATLKQLILDVDKEWAGAWKWRPQRPVTIYLYSDATRMFYDVERITGVPWPLEARQSRLGEEMFAVKDATTGGSAVLVAFKGSLWGLEGIQGRAQLNMLRGYAHVMLGDVGARGLPVWFFEGISEYVAFARNPREVGAEGTVTAATGLFNIGQIVNSDPPIFPTLRALSSSYWYSMVTSGEGNKRSAYGIAYLAVKYLVDKVGTQRVAQVVQATAAGESFESALQRFTGFTVERLDVEYRGQFSRAGWTSMNFTPWPAIQCKQ